MTCTPNSIYRDTGTGQTYHCSPQHEWVRDYRPDITDTIAVLVIAAFVLTLVMAMARGRIR
jgi:hypothetical protein